MKAWAIKDLHDLRYSKILLDVLTKLHQPLVKAGAILGTFSNITKCTRIYTITYTYCTHKLLIAKWPVNKFEQKLAFVSFWGAINYIRPRGNI